MKVKMLEHYQDASVQLQPDQIADVDPNLAAWLLEHHKAVTVEKQPLTFEPAPEVIENVTNVETEVEEEEKPKRRRSK